MLASVPALGPASQDGAVSLPAQHAASSSVGHSPSASPGNSQLRPSACHTCAVSLAPGPSVLQLLNQPSPRTRRSFFVLPDQPRVCRSVWWKPGQAGRQDKLTRLAPWAALRPLWAGTGPEQVYTPARPSAACGVRAASGQQTVREMLGADATEASDRYGQGLGERRPNPLHHLSPTAMREEARAPGVLSKPLDLPHPQTRPVNSEGQLLRKAPKFWPVWLSS